MKKIFATASISIFTLLLASNSFAQFGSLLGDLKSATEKIQQPQQNAPSQNSNSSPPVQSTPPAPTKPATQTAMVNNLPPLAKANGDVTNKNIKATLEQFDKQFKNS